MQKKFDSFKMTANGRISLLLLVVISFFACNPPSPQSGEGKVTVYDILGRKVVVPEKVTKVIGVRAGALRLLVYMDAVEMVAGIEESEFRGSRPYIQAHPELLKRPIIGPSMGGDAELIAGTNPDVIFITYTTRGDADALQKRTGIPVVALECTEFGTARDTLFASLRLIGKIIGKEKRADSLITYIENNIRDLNRRSQILSSSARPRVYIGGVPYSGARNIVSTQPYYPPFMFVNAHNVASELSKNLISHVKGTYVDPEQLLIWNPDYLFIDVSGLTLIKKDLASETSVYRNLNAIKNNNIYLLLPYNNYATNYELVLINAWYTGKILYPEAFNDVMFEEKVQEILDMFLATRSILAETIISQRVPGKVNANDL